MSGQIDFFSLPASREEWEREYPDCQSRYLAFCNAAQTSPWLFTAMHEFMAWIGARLAEYRAEKGMSREEPLAGRQDDFTDWLWSKGARA